ncbi:choice-of-anchor L domain-containing protein [Aquimarina celericrescens]|uniref:Choice-of-anchor L domain-containing protein n=1 Tax=Aquimarina celericrescens TaxID=1964542 RepID=A0ABW5AUK4_9FLAO
MKKITPIILCIVLILSFQEMFSQATFTSNPTDVDILNELAGPGLTLSNPTLEYGSKSIQFATFSNGNAGANFTVDTGLMMTTGSTTQAFGSNGTAAFPSNSGLQASTTAGLATYSDPDITAIDAGAVHDVAVFSFDVTLDPGLTAIQIVYQFGSDEYPDYVGTTFNDAFGFFVSGPGITGSQNIAKVPGTDNPVAVNTVNGGYLGCQQASFPSSGTVDISKSSQFIVNGHDVETPPGPPGSCNTNSGAFTVFTEYNGITKQFTGTINELTPGVTYRFKIAIADTGDASLDSAVFINQIIGTTDIDGDGTSDMADLDDDNDGILDIDENIFGIDPSGDADADLIPNYKDFDNNGTATSPVCTDGNADGICDTLDPAFDFDGDNVSDHLDLDSDNDGIYDVDEAGGTDVDNNGIADGTPGTSPTTNGIPASAGSGLALIETTSGTSDHLNTDSDSDGCTDANEAYSDPDADGGDGGQFGTTDPATVDGEGLVTEPGIDYTLGTNTAVTDSSIVSICIDATDDTNSIQIIDVNGGEAVSNILGNDTLGTATATTATVDITVVTPASNPGVSLNTLTGTVNVTGGTPTGFYTIVYQICEASLTAPCATATITIFVDVDTDNDGIGNATDLDDDNDGILDTAENSLGVDPSGDADMDEILNYLDATDNGSGTAPVCTDGNADGICDTLDTVFDSDGDEVPNHFDLDGDNDGIYDVVEAGGTPSGANPGQADGAVGTTPTTNGIPATAGTGLMPIDTLSDGSFDFQNLDSDGDGCSDANEAYASATADGGDTGIYGDDAALTVDLNTGLVTTPSSGVDYTIIPANADGIAPTNDIQADFQQAGTQPAILTQPSNVLTNGVSAETFEVEPNVNYYSYQWQVNDGGGFVNIDPADMTDIYTDSDTSILTLTGVTAAEDGYQYQVIITDNTFICTTTTSNSASLTFDDIATIAITTPIEIDDIVNGTEVTDVTISGTTTGVEAGQTVTVTFSDGVNPDVTTTANVNPDGSWTATDADISSLNDGGITVDADVSDLAGNAVNDQAPITLDTAPGTITITTPIEVDDIVNGTEVTDVTISGTTIDVETGQTVTVTFSDGVNPDVTVTAMVGAGGAWTATDADISSLDEGPITVDADVSDLAGNTANDQAPITLDTAATITITTPIEVDDIVNGTEVADVTISGTTTDVETGQTVTVTFSDGVNPDVTTTANVNPDGSWTATDADISSLNDGGITVDADVSDLAGNAANDQAPITLDTAATIAITTPIEIDDIVNGTEVTDVTISGTTTGVEAGQTVTVTFSDGVNPDVTVTAMVGAGGAWTATDADISSLDEGPITVDADVSDLAGNTANDQAPITLDTTATIAITTPIEIDDIVNGTEVTDVTISGTTTGVEAGQTVTVTFSDGVNPDVTVTAMVGAGGAWTATDADISSLDEGPITVDADVSDLAGNTANDQAPITLDTTATIAITTPIEIDDIVNGTEVTDVTISGTTTGVEAGQTVTVTFSDGANPDVTTTANVNPDGSWTATDADISSLNDGGITVDADVSDLAGNAANDQAPITLDTAATITITTPIEIDDIVNGTEVTDVTISGTTTDVETGQTVTVTFSDGVNPDVTTTANVNPDGSWTATDADISSLNDGGITVDADVSDLAGNTANDQAPITLDTAATVAINTPVEIDDIVNISEAGDVTISGTTTDVEAGQTVTVTFSDGVSPDVVTTATVQPDGSWTATDADIGDLINGLITIDAGVTDVAGNSVNDQVVITLDDTILITITTPIEIDDVVNAAEVSDVTLRGTTNDVEPGQIVTVTFSDGTNPDVVTTATVNPDGSWTAADANISNLDAGTITIDANVSDSVGNTATDQVTVILDVLSGVVIDTPIEVDNIVNASEANDVVVSGATTDVEAGQTVTVTFSDGVNPNVTAITTVQADGSWTIIDTNISGLNSGTVIIDINTSDIAGNNINIQQNIILDQNIPIVDTVLSNDLTPILSGVAEPNETILVGVDSNGDSILEVIYTVVADAAGNWSVDPDITTPDSGSFPVLIDQQVIDITATDIAGNMGIGMIQIDLTDTDADGFNDLEEEANDTDPLDPCDPDPFALRSADCDNDGIANEFEIGDDVDNPQDTDADGIPDFLDDDDDGDDILTSEENPDPDGDGNPLDAFDADGDGTPDYLEQNNINPQSEDGVEIFNIVTPNGDGDHDVLTIANIEKFPDNEIKIFNRWGVVVYEAKGYGQNGEFFRGESNGRATLNAEDQLPVGTYFYILTYRTEDGSGKKISDYLYINR